MLHSNVLSNEPVKVVQVGAVTSLTVMVRETGSIVLPQASIDAAQVSITFPLQLSETEVEKVEVLEVPLTRHVLPCPLLKGKVLANGNWSQPTVMSAGTVNFGIRAGDTVMLRVLVIVLENTSVKLHVSTIVPPQAPAGLCALSVDSTEPTIWHWPVTPFV